MFAANLTLSENGGLCHVAGLVPLDVSTCPAVPLLPLIFNAPPTSRGPVVFMPPSPQSFIFQIGRAHV